MKPIQVKKLLLSKWTAVEIIAKQKHFLVSAVITPEISGQKIEWIELEAVYNKKKRRIRWSELYDESCWRQGWL